MLGKILQVFCIMNLIQYILYNFNNEIEAVQCLFFVCLNNIFCLFWKWRETILITLNVLNNVSASINMYFITLQIYTQNFAEFTIVIYRITIVQHFVTDLGLNKTVCDSRLTN